MLRVYRLERHAGDVFRFISLDVGNRSFYLVFINPQKRFWDSFYNFIIYSQVFNSRVPYILRAHIMNIFGLKPIIYSSEYE